MMQKMKMQKSTKSNLNCQALKTVESRWEYKSGDAPPQSHASLKFERCLQELMSRDGACIIMSSTSYHYLLISIFTIYDLIHC